MLNRFFVIGFCFLVLVTATRADTVTLSDGSTFTGDILKFDDQGLMLRLQDNNYTNISWSQFSQDSLKQLSQNQKIAPYVTPFIEPAPVTPQAQVQVNIKPVSRLPMPAHASILGGLFGSSVGLFILFAIYVSNLVAAYEISVMKLRKPAEVMGLSAILPIIGPVIFLWLPEQTAAGVEEAPTEVVTAPAGTAGNPTEQIPIVEITNKPEEKKTEPQVFSRGKFTFNKRFVETKFAGFIGVPKGEALAYTMELKTPKDVHAVENILQVSASEVMLETKRGQFTVLLSDIQEIKLNPKPA